MNPFTKIWFWLLILSIIGFIMSFIFFESMGETSSGNNTTPAWVWIIFILSLIFLIVAFILYAIDLAAYHRRMEIAEACGELPPPPPKKKIECPKRECVEKRVVECVERNPKKQCVETVPTDDSGIVVDVSQVQNPNKAQNIVTVTTNTDEAFSAASLKPLASLAPPSTVVSV